MDTVQDAVIQQIPSPASHSLHIFISGLVTGQLLLLLMLLALIKLVFLKNSFELAHEAPLTRPTPPRVNPPLQSILPSVTRHATNQTIFQSETAGWLNVMVAQLVERYRRDSQSIVAASLSQVLNQSRPDWLSFINVDLFSLGNSLPTIKSAKLSISDKYKPGNYKVDLDMEWSTTTIPKLPPSQVDIPSTPLKLQTMFAGKEFISNSQATAAEGLSNSGMAFGVSTQILVHWPRRNFAALPTSLAISIVRFNGIVSLEFVDHEDGTAYGYMSVDPNFELEFDVKSLLGHKTRVKDLPKLTEVLTGRIKRAFSDLVVEPNSIKFAAPTTVEMLTMMGVVSSALPDEEKTPIMEFTHQSEALAELRRRSHVQLGHVHEHHASATP